MENIFKKNPNQTKNTQNPRPGGDQKLLMELHAVASFALLIAVSILMIAVVQQMR